MVFEFSHDTEELRTSVQRFLKDQAGLSIVRKSMNSDAPFDSHLWSLVKELGWTASIVPEQFGGLGFGAEQASVFFQEVGGSLAPIPLLSTLFAADLIARRGSPEQQERWLPGIADGSIIATVAWCEEDSRDPAEANRTRVAGGRISGVKRPVADLLGADIAIVSAGGADASFYIVDLHGAGVGVQQVETMDLVRRHGILTLSDAAADPIGTSEDLDTWLDRAAILSSWEAIGAAEAAMKLAVAYAKDRVAFGQRIGRFQGVKHKCSEMYARIEMARIHALRAILALDRDEPGLRHLAAAARLAALDAARFCAEENVQVHGGIGFTWEADPQFYYRRSRQLTFALGGREFWTNRLATALCARDDRDGSNVDITGTETSELACYRAEARNWIAANVGASKALLSGDEASLIAAQKHWQMTKHLAGYTGIGWPVSAGGQGRTAMDAIIFEQEEIRQNAPTGLFSVGLGICIPAILAHGTPEIIERFVPRALSGEEVWCQLFSEPAAGSDLASIRTRAERDGDDWVINGQKVWTSNAHLSNYAIALTRTDPSVPRHSGMTMFIVDMSSPGVDVRPLKQMSGRSEFNEVFLTDVRVPDAFRVGPVGLGWKVALTTLGNERVSAGGKPHDAPDLQSLIDLGRRFGENGGSDALMPRLRDRIVRTYLAEEGVLLIQLRGLSATARGETPGPEQAICKIITAKSLQETADFILDLAGGDGFLVQDDAGSISEFQKSYLWSAGLRIAGGTDEILRNIIAERVLGLPSDLRPNRDVAFNQEVAV